MYHRQLFILIFATVFGTAVAAEPSPGPVIKDYGPTYDVGAIDVPLPPGYRYKVVFDVAADASPGAVNRNLVSVARYLNMHARNGVPADRMDLAVVVHGRALQNVLRHDDNPNAELVAALQAAGVRFYVCGQSLVHAGLDKADLMDDVDLALSAMTMLTLLQGDGYALISWGAN